VTGASLTLAAATELSIGEGSSLTGAALTLAAAETISIGEGAELSVGDTSDTLAGIAATAITLGDGATLNVGTALGFAVETPVTLGELAADNDTGVHTGKIISSAITYANLAKLTGLAPSEGDPLNIQQKAALGSGGATTADVEIPANTVVTLTDAGVMKATAGYDSTPFKITINGVVVADGITLDGQDSTGGIVLSNDTASGATAAGSVTISYLGTVTVASSTQNGVLTIPADAVVRIIDVDTEAEADYVELSGVTLSSIDSASITLTGTSVAGKVEIADTSSETGSLVIAGGGSIKIGGASTFVVGATGDTKITLTATGSTGEGVFSVNEEADSITISQAAAKTGSITGAGTTPTLSIAGGTMALATYDTTGLTLTTAFIDVSGTSNTGKINLGATNIIKTADNAATAGIKFGGAAAGPDAVTLTGANDAEAPVSSRFLLEL
jgi:hypothetical protein